MRLPWFATALLITQGCATQHAYFGHGSTDLSGLRAGVSRADVEKVTGAPEGLDAGDGAYVACYVYDRGYVRTLEGQGTASKIVMVPVLAWGELLTLGLLGASLEHCQEVCQKGQLVVRYDASDRLVSATESPLPASHALLDGCLNTPVRATHAHCEAVRTMARASSLPASYGR